MRQAGIYQIQQLILELNELAEERKEKVDKLWIAAHHQDASQIQDCTDDLWLLEDKGEALRTELLKLLGPLQSKPQAKKSKSGN